MKNPDPENIPSKVYVIVYKCENLPDLRTEKEKKKNKKSLWQVIFPDAKESLASNLQEGTSEVIWMVESFLTIKNSSNSFSMSVIDDKSRKAGTVSISLNDILIGDKDILKPGRKYEGAREAYRNMEPIQTAKLNFKSIIISFWMWAIAFREPKKESSNLAKLKTFSKSATNLFKPSNIPFFIPETNTNVNSYTNPFESEYQATEGNSSTNPFENSDSFDGKLTDQVGNSTFTNTEFPKFRSSIWLPQNTNDAYSNPFAVPHRSSSLPGLAEHSKQLIHEMNSEIEEFKKNIMDQKLSFGVSEHDLQNLNALSEIYETRKTGPKNSEMIKVLDEEFFTLLNDLRRQFANNIIKIKSLEMENKDLTDELSELRKRFYTVKKKLIENGMSNFLQDN